jgi:hypothetical protein
MDPYLRREVLVRLATAAARFSTGLAEALYHGGNRYAIDFFEESFRL